MTNRTPLCSLVRGIEQFISPEYGYWHSGQQEFSFTTRVMILFGFASWQRIAVNRIFVTLNMPNMVNIELNTFSLEIVESYLQNSINVTFMVKLHKIHF
jgi:hypothetical protein